MCITQRQAGGHPEAITNSAPYFSFGPFSHVSNVEGEGCKRFSVEVTQLDRHRAVQHFPKELSPSLSMSSLIRSLITQMKSIYLTLEVDWMASFPYHGRSQAPRWRGCREFGISSLPHWGFIVVARQLVVSS